MQSFIATVEATISASYLRWPLTVREPSAGSRTCCSTTLRKEKSWFEFRDGRMEERALKWLESIGVSLIEE